MAVAIGFVTGVYIGLFRVVTLVCRVATAGQSRNDHYERYA